MRHQHATRIEQREIAHRPRLVFRRTHAHPEPPLDTDRLQMRVPVVDVLDQQVHLEVADECRLIEGLQQEGRLAMAYVRQIPGGPLDLEADSCIELL